MRDTQKVTIAAILGAVFVFSSPDAPKWEPSQRGPKQFEYAFDLNPDLRIQNFKDAWGSGSCVHVSWAMLLRWQGQYDLANWWTSNYDGGERHSSFIEKLHATGIPYMTTYGEGDVEFLETACASRRGCMVTTTYYRSGDHMILLVHLDDHYAYTLDNNDISTVYRWDRTEFIDLWRDSGSWATTPMYTPPPPKPHS
jgi:hypothetical protein